MALDWGLRPNFVGVRGTSLPLPAAGDGAMLLDVRCVLGEEWCDLEATGDDLFGVGGKE